VVFVASAAVALAAFSATSSSHAAGLKKSSGSGRSANTDRSRKSFSTMQATDGSTGLLNEWAACARSHGDSNQADPTVEHQVIYIATQMVPGGGDPSAIPACSGYLTAAQSAVAGGQPVKGWGDTAASVQYANCMRAHGYPTFPYPSGRIEPDGNPSTNFNGTGIDPMSPAFLNGNANQMCGKQIGAPAWWINSWGPPGSVDEYLAGTNPNRPLPPIGAVRNGPKPTTVPGVNGGPGGNGPCATAPSAARAVQGAWNQPVVDPCRRLLEQG
jgi:hypothetical protein